MKKLIIALTLLSSFSTFANTDSESLVAKAREVNPDKKIILVRANSAQKCSDGVCFGTIPSYIAKAKEVNPDKKIILVRSITPQDCLKGICVGDVVYSEDTNQFGANVVAIDRNEGTLSFSDRYAEDEKM